MSGGGGEFVAAAVPVAAGGFGGAINASTMGAAPAEHTLTRFPWRGSLFESGARGEGCFGAPVRRS